MIQPGQLVVLEVKHSASSRPVMVNPRTETNAAQTVGVILRQWFGKKAPVYALLCKDHNGCVFIMRPNRA